MQISANYYSIMPPRFIAGTKGSYGVEKLEIKFSEEWEGLIKKVVFYPPEGEAVSVIYESEPIDIPLEVMSVRGRTKYAIIGYKGEKKLVSVAAELDVLATLEDTESMSKEPTPDEMTQVFEYMRTAVDVANSVKRELENIKGGLGVGGGDNGSKLE